MTAQKPLPKKENGYYVFTLSSYDGVDLTITKPQLNYEAAAQMANQLIANHGGSHESSYEWFKEEFGVPSAQDLFKACVFSQQQEIEAYTKHEIQTGLSGNLALRLNEEIPEDLLEAPAQALLAQEIEAMKTTFFEMNAIDPSVQEAAAELARAKARDQLARSFALEAYANHFEIMVSQSDVDAFEQTPEFEVLKKNNANQAQLVQTILYNKVFDHLQDRSTITIL